MNSINFISNLFLLLLYKNVTRKWVSFSYNFLNVVMTTFFNIYKKLLIVFNSTLFISKKLQNDNNAHKMIFFW